MYIEDEIDFQNKCKDFRPSRRGFLGSVLGVFAAANLNWVARQPFVEPIIQPLTSIPDYTSYQRLIDGTIIQGPGAKCIIDGIIQLHDINIYQAMTVTSSILYHKGRLISDANFRSQQYVLNGDTLKISHKLELKLLEQNRVVKPGDPDWQYYYDKKFPK